MKKILALVLAALLVLSMTAAFAADEEITGASYDATYFSISDGATAITLKDHTFKAVQVLSSTGYDTTTKEYTGLTWGAQVTDGGVKLLAALKADSTLGFANFVTSSPTNAQTLLTPTTFAKQVSGYNATQAKALAQALKNVNWDGTPQQFVYDGSTAVDLTAGSGYYLIDDITTNVPEGDVLNPVILFATPGSNIIRIKADKPSVEKKIDGSSDTDDTTTGLVDYNTASIGADVPYVITAPVPSMEFYDKYYMEFSDELSQGLTFKASTDANAVDGIIVTVEEKDNSGEWQFVKYLKATDGVTVVVDPATKDLTKQEPTSIKVKIDDVKVLATAGQRIKLSYSATVNKNAVVGVAGNPNKVKLIYSNNPDQSGDGDHKTHTSETPEDFVITYLTRIKVLKQDGTTSQALAGAVFQLKGKKINTTLISGTRFVEDAAGTYYKCTDGSYTTDASNPAADTTKKYKKEDFTNEVVVGTADGEDYYVEAVSDASGNLTFTGLGQGVYTFTEIQAPFGYNKLTNPISLTVKATFANTDSTGTETVTWSIDPVTGLTGVDTVAWDATESALKFIVNNNSGTTLPETGGIGTTIFYVGGGLLILAAVILLVTKRRMSGND